MSTQSLPSFAQAFSTIPPTDALPPIMASRKRTQDDDSVRVKQEHDIDGAPPPSALMPAPKKRRVTVSGAAPQPLHIDVRPPHDVQSASTPISPVVIGFPVPRDNPAAIEQVRNMINVKQKQKALIEQRRGSAAGLLSPVPPHTPVDDRTPSTAGSTAGAAPASASTPRASRRSPNTSTRRTNPQRPPSPPVPTSLQLSQAQAQSQGPPPPIPQHSLPPPPISFARRRAALLGGKRKPADIVISPRDAHTRDQLQPAIQSAPPVPHAAAAQGQFYGARFTMALPRLPTITGAENPRRVAGNVPPTPTRLSMLQQQQQHHHQQQQGQGQGPSLAQHGQAQPHGPSTLGPGPAPTRSPPASVPIASTLVPPTPTTLTRAGSTYARAADSDRAAFLAPFELFYDALGDARTLKGWLADQLRESRALMQSLAAAQDRRAESIDAAVERRMAAVRAEVGALRRRVDELEGALAAAQGSRQVNGGPPAVEAYTFPPAEAAANAAAGPSSGARMRPELTRRLSSPISGWGDQRERERERERDWERERERDRERERARSEHGGSPRTTPLLGRPREAQAGAAERERDFYADRAEREREYVERAEREREREGLRERDREPTRRNSIVMAAPEEEEEDDNA